MKKIYKRMITSLLLTLSFGSTSCGQGLDLDKISSDLNARIEAIEGLMTKPTIKLN